MHDVASNNIFSEVVALLLLAVAVGAVAMRLRQPVLVGFILVGIIVGPSVLGVVRSNDEIHLLAELGLALLLFVVGLKLDVGHIRSAGLATLTAGSLLVFTMAVLGYLIALALGYTGLPAAYIAAAMTFSSTIIVIKLLTDKRETDALHGRLAIGILIVEDIVAIIAMIILSGLGSGNDVSRQLLIILTKGSALIAGLALFSVFILPRILRSVSESRELLLLFSIAFAVGMANLTQLLGFSLEVGAFLAGIALASTGFRDTIASRLVSLRDFLLIFFFIELGASFDFRALGDSLWMAIPLSLFVLLMKPILVMSILGVMGYRKRVSFLTALSLDQISEFSLIIVALGLSLGHISTTVSGVITLVALITIAISSYLISFSNTIYEKIAPRLNVFQRKTPPRMEIDMIESAHAFQPDVILYGTGRFGSSIATQLRNQGNKILGIDFDPQTVRNWNRRGWKSVFGDAEDPEFPAMIPLQQTRWIISSIREMPTNLTLIDSLKQHGYEGGIAVTARDLDEADKMRQAGAVEVFVPLLDSASQAVDILNEANLKETRRKMDSYISGLHDHYIVCGYGRMGQQIVKDFKRSAVPFVVIEYNPEQLPKLIEANIPFVEGKATEDEILTRAGIERAKGLVAVTTTDEENVFIVLSARSLNPKLHIVARSTRSENESKLRKAGADKVMSPYVLGGRQMASAVLKPQVMNFLEMVLHGDELDLELGEVYVSKSSALADKSIRESGVAESGLVILAIHKSGGEMKTTPTPDSEIAAGDHLIVIGSSAQIASAQKLARDSKVAK